MPPTEPSSSARVQECPTHGVCPPCREGWGHYTPGRGYVPTIQSIQRTKSAGGTDE